MKIHQSTLIAALPIEESPNIDQTTHPLSLKRNGDTPIGENTNSQFYCNGLIPFGGSYCNNQTSHILTTMTHNLNYVITVEEERDNAVNALRKKGDQMIN